MSVELSESVLNGRFSVSEKPLVAPGKCAVCGSVSKPVVDFGFDLEFYGTVYLCGDCILEAYTLLSAVFPDIYASQAQVVPLPTFNREALDAYLRDASDSIARLNLLLPPPVPSNEDAEAEPRYDAADSSESTGEPSEASNTPDELANVEGPDDATSSNVSNVFSFDRD